MENKDIAAGCPAYFEGYRMQVGGLDEKGRMHLIRPKGDTVEDCPFGDVTTLEPLVVAPADPAEIFALLSEEAAVHAKTPKQAQAQADAKRVFTHLSAFIAEVGPVCYLPGRLTPRLGPAITIPKE